MLAPLLILVKLSSAQFWGPRQEGKCGGCDVTMNDTKMVVKNSNDSFV